MESKNKKETQNNSFSLEQGLLLNKDLINLVIWIKVNIYVSLQLNIFTKKKVKSV